MYKALVPSAWRSRSAQGCSARNLQSSLQAHLLRAGGLARLAAREDRHGCKRWTEEQECGRVGAIAAAGCGKVRSEDHDLCMRILGMRDSDSKTVKVLGCSSPPQTAACLSRPAAHPVPARDTRDSLIIYYQCLRFNSRLTSCREADCARRRRPNCRRRRRHSESAQRPIGSDRRAAEAELR